MMHLTPSIVDATSKRQRQIVEEEEDEKRQGFDMPEEMMDEILVRLPVKSLVRFKATCKRWWFLIKSPCFIDMHRRRHCDDYHDLLLLSRQADDGLVTMYSCSVSEHNHNPAVTTTPLFDLGWLPRLPEFAKWPFLGDDDQDQDDDDDHHCTPQPFTDVFGPLNSGIYLHIHCDFQKLNHVSIGTSKFALCNVATREYKFLNPFPSDFAAFFSKLVQVPCQASFGFGPVHDKAGLIVDYKVVVILLCVIPHSDNSYMLSFVYSMRRGSWENIADVRRGTRYSRMINKAPAIAGLVNEQGLVDSPRLLFNKGSIVQQQAFLNGSWHWLEVYRLGVKSRGYDRVLLFDVANEAFRYFFGPLHDYFRLISPTRSTPPYEIRRGLFLLYHRLAVIYMPHDVLENRFCCVGIDVWIMMDYGDVESWTKIYSAKPAINDFSAYFLGLRYSTCTTDSGTDSIRIRTIFLRNRYTGQLVSWDGSQVTDLGFNVRIHHGGLWNLIGVSSYVETLQSLDLQH